MATIDEFETHRPLLSSIAYRMTGSLADADDLVQETFLRWQKTSADEVQSPRALLSTIVTRLAIDHLRSARVQREHYIGPWLPEPVVKHADTPAGSAELPDSLSMAFLVLLETLTPLERAVFLLRQVFDHEYSEIAQMVGKSEANCRQIVSRARQHLAEQRPSATVAAREDHLASETLAAEFLTAMESGNLERLLGLLAEDVTLKSDGGGLVVAARRPILGALNVARFLVGIMKKRPPQSEIIRSLINEQPGAVTYVSGQVYNTLSLDIHAGQVREIYIVINPEKLRHVPAKA